MRIKSVVLTIFALFSVLAVFAQDKIVKKNGEIIEAKVSVINQDNIVFKRFDNLDGPEYAIPKADVARIKYKNGTEDIFEEDNDKIGVARHDMAKSPTGPVKGRRSMNDDGRGVKPNIISVAPIAVTENGAGIALTYEHALDAKGVVNFYLPVFLTFSKSLYTNDNTVTNHMFYAMPGIKVYTNLNSSKKAKFSIGPSLIVAAGSTDQYGFDYVSGQYTGASRFMLGGMANIGINLFPTPRFYIGAELGMGLTYVNYSDDVREGMAELAQFSMKIGYRYGHKSNRTKIN